MAAVKAYLVGSLCTQGSAHHIPSLELVMSFTFYLTYTVKLWLE